MAAPRVIPSENRIIDGFITDKNHGAQAMVPLADGGYAALTADFMSCYLQVFDHDLKLLLSKEIPFRAEYTSILTLGDNIVVFADRQRENEICHRLSWAQRLDSRPAEFTVYNIKDLDHPRKFSIVNHNAAVTLHAIPGNQELILSVLDQSSIYLTNISSGISKRIFTTSKSILNLRVLSGTSFIVVLNYQSECSKTTTVSIEQFNPDLCWNKETATDLLSNTPLIEKNQSILTSCSLHTYLDIQQSADGTLVVLLTLHPKHLVYFFEFLKKNNEQWEQLKRLPCLDIAAFTILPDDMNSIFWINKKGELYLYQHQLGHEVPVKIGQLVKPQGTQHFYELMQNGEGYITINSYSYHDNGGLEDTVQTSLTLASIVQKQLPHLEEIKREVTKSIIPDLADLPMDYLTPNYRKFKRFTLSSNFNPSELNKCYLAIINPERTKIDLSSLFTSGLSNHQFELQQVKKTAENNARSIANQHGPEIISTHYALLELTIPLTDGLKTVAELKAGSALSLDIVAAIEIFSKDNNPRAKTQKEVVPLETFEIRQYDVG